MTFEELSNKWFDTEIVGYTYQYTKCLQSAVKHLNSRFKNYNIEEIKSEDIKRFLTERYAFNPNTGKRGSKKLLSDIVDTGSRIYEFAIDNEYCSKNPFHNKRNLIPKRATQKTRMPLSKRQQELVMIVEHRTKTAAIIMMMCGLRLGEVLALKWDDIDFKNKKISLTKSAEQISPNQYEITPHTKNGKDRYVPIPDNIINYLKNQCKEAESYLICPKTDGNLQTPSSYKQMWNSYQKEINYQEYKFKQIQNNENINSKFSPNGVPKVIDSFTAHQLRHTYCTLLYFSGVDAVTASKLMGHSSIEITLKIYTHLDEQFKQYNISKFNNYLKQNF